MHRQQQPTILENGMDYAAQDGRAEQDSEDRMWSRNSLRGKQWEFRVEIMGKYFAAFGSGKILRNGWTNPCRSIDSPGLEECGQKFTRADMQGPFYLPKAPIRNMLVPEEELRDRNKAVLLEGQVFDKDCQLIAGAMVEVWYFSPTRGNYTFPCYPYPCQGRGCREPTFPYDDCGKTEESPESDEDGDTGVSRNLWFRGRTMTDEYGRYVFAATYPGNYSARPIKHYHFKVTAEETEFITQSYPYADPEELVATSYEDYPESHCSEFPKVERHFAHRRIENNIRLKIKSTPKSSSTSIPTTPTTKTTTKSSSTSTSTSTLEPEPRPMGRKEMSLS